MGNKLCYYIDAISSGKLLSTYITYVQKNGSLLFYRWNYESIAICYMINTVLNCNKVFREQVKKRLSILFTARIMETIRDCLKKKNKCVMTLIMIYENNGGNAKKCIEF